MFLPVKRYEWLYYFDVETNTVVSNDRIINRKNWWIENKKWRILSPYIWAYWHIYYDLYCNWRREKSSMHLIVAEYFFWKKEKWMEVCHNDWNPKNNHPDNLRYWTHKENMKDRTLHWRTISNLWNTWIKSKLSKIVNQYSLDWVLIGKYFWTMDIKRILWYDPSSISKCCRGILDTAYWFKWLYDLWNWCQWHQ